ncbi:hypothetical protein GQ42DRAFT_3653 [Ramicandelaber brevisporus]|nr:hypothetical protein GQ42DRAFT_3653 [Ramicandelaber brevisporus]
MLRRCGVCATAVVVPWFIALLCAVCCMFICAVCCVCVFCFVYSALCSLLLCFLFSAFLPNRCLHFIQPRLSQACQVYSGQPDSISISVGDSIALGRLAVAARRSQPAAAVAAVVAAAVVAASTPLRRGARRVSSEQARTLAAPHSPNNNIRRFPTHRQTASAASLPRTNRSTQISQPPSTVCHSDHLATLCSLPHSLLYLLPHSLLHSLFYSLLYSLHYSLFYSQLYPLAAPLHAVINASMHQRIISSPVHLFTTSLHYSVTTSLHCSFTTSPLCYITASLNNDIATLRHDGIWPIRCRHHFACTELSSTVASAVHSQ